ncbi:hypothetical protein [Hyperthermus butylicus]|uniref:Csa3 N-terminal domain-containing protein n=1 Tax=Hyperthermus butylicus (strain DSM 5456 / JCM 9403 / PLM1-5) TaxID=415426 RepID=A2BKK2_HYPBU|nr:hypothetical protein [Hyperthermus butylicus]ABM80513.1 hypothetical protein Hbut_0657 [Hyperthermus butylicus DSM 5456]
MRLVLRRRTLSCLGMSQECPTLIATMGFDEKFVIRAVLDHRPKKIIVVGLRVSSDAWSRVEKAYNSVSQLAVSTGASSSLVGLDAAGIIGGDRAGDLEFASLVREVKKILRSALGETSSCIVLSLTGGPAS